MITLYKNFNFFQRMDIFQKLFYGSKDNLCKISDGIQRNDQHSIVSDTNHKVDYVKNLKKYRE